MANRRNPTTWSGAPSSSDLSAIAGVTRQGYTFQDVLGQMGLNDMVGRVQDAVTGRFLSADPNIPDPTDPQSYNRYSYTRNNPLTYTDPSGFDDTCSTSGPGCGGSSGSMDPAERIDGFVTVYSASGSTYTYVTDQETAQGVGGGKITVTDVFQGDSIQWNAQGGMSNLLGSYHDGQWSSSGLDDSFQGGGGLLGFGGVGGFGGFSGGFGRSGGYASAAVGVQQGIGSKVGKWAYGNIAIEPHVQGGVVLLGGSASSDMNLSAVSGSGGLGFGYLGLDAGIDAAIHVTGPELSDGFYRSYSICAGLGFGGCLTFNFQNGNMSTQLSLGANLGLSASGSYQYQKTFLGPAPYPGAQ